MTAFQFIHVETYGRAAPKKAATARWTIRDVTAEAAREPGACAHVVAPRPPVLLHGAPLADVEREIVAGAEHAHDAAGRRLRRDAQLLLAGVASFPVRLDQAGDEERRAYDAWECDTIAWLQKTYRRALRAVVRHEDEPYGHIHFFVAADITAGERIDAFHPGRRAIAEAKAAGINKKSDLDRAYRQAMRGFQDDYYAAVGVRHGLTRRGPGRRRLTRNEWQQERASAENVAHGLRRADAAIERAANLEQETITLAVEAAKEGTARRQAERERDEWRGTARRLDAELRDERERAAGLERLLAETREKLATTAAQAMALVRTMLDPAAALPARCPAWLGAELWSKVRARVISRLDARSLHRPTTRPENWMHFLSSIDR